MDWQSIIKSLGLFTVGSISIAGIIVYFSKRIFENQLSILNNEHLYRYNTLYSEKLLVYKETYKRIVKAEKSLEYLLRPLKFGQKKSKEEITDETFTFISDLFEYYDENEIFFDNSSVDLLEQLRGKFTKAWGANWQADFMEQARGTPEWVETIENKKHVYETIISNEIPNLKKQLKQDFQKNFKVMETFN